MDDEYTRAKLQHAESQARTNAMQEVAVAEAGRRLAAEFIARRHPMQIQAQAEENERAAKAHVKPKVIWCSLNLFSRYRDGGVFELSWKYVHMYKGNKDFEYIRRRRTDGNFDVRDLGKRAYPFELDLILEFEQRASVLRADWKRVIQIRTALRHLAKQGASPTALAA